MKVQENKLVLYFQIFKKLAIIQFNDLKVEKSDQQLDLVNLMEFKKYNVKHNRLQLKIFKYLFSISYYVKFDTPPSEL